MVMALYTEEINETCSQILMKVREKGTEVVNPLLGRISIIVTEIQTHGQALNSHQLSLLQQKYSLECIISGWRCTRRNEYDAS